MSRIDYSKWDHIDLDSDDDEKEHNDSIDCYDKNSRSNRVQVTRLDAPSRVVIEPPTQAGGGVGAITVLPSSPSYAPPNTDVKESETTNSLSSRTGARSECEEGRTSVPVADQDMKSVLVSEANRIPSSWTERGGMERLSTRTTNGTLEEVLYWTQDRYTVTFRMKIPNDVTSTSTKWVVQATNVLPYKERNHATASILPHLTIRQLSCDINSRCNNQSNQGLIWWEGELPHPIHSTEEEDEEEGSVDWTIEQNQGQRFMIIVLNKAVPMAGVFFVVETTHDALC